MKSLFFSFILLLSLGSYAQVKVGAEGNIISTGLYPVAKSNDLKGSVHDVQTLIQRNAIAPNFRTLGMLVYVADSLKYYFLNSGILNANWTELQQGSGGGGIGCLVTYHVTPDSLYLVKDSCGSIVDSTQWVGGGSGGGNNDAYNNVEQGFDSTFFILKRANGTQDTVVINNTGSGGSDNLQTYTSGSSVTVTNGVNILLINPSILQSSLSITLPAIPSVRNDIEIYFGGTIAAGSDVVTTITIVGNTGQTLFEALVPTTISSGEYLSYKWIPSLNRWYAKR